MAFTPRHSPFMPEYRRRLPYIGKPRTELIGGRWANRQQRAFAAPQTAVIWSPELQAAAIERGFFLERAAGQGPDNHVRVLPLKGLQSDVDVVNALEQSAFRGDEFALTALAFIEQQDRYGYSGAWHESVQKWTATLHWYKERKAAARAVARAKTEAGRVYAARRWRKPPTR